MQMQKRYEKDMAKLTGKGLAGCDDMDALVKGVKGTLGDQLRLLAKCHRIDKLYRAGRYEECVAVAQAVPLVTARDAQQLISTAMRTFKVKSGQQFGSELLFSSLWC